MPFTLLRPVCRLAIRLYFFALYHLLPTSGNLFAFGMVGLILTNTKDQFAWEGPVPPYKKQPVNLHDRFRYWLPATNPCYSG
ncbi:hypothetical protein [Leptolinea tardivitalis]|uniref:Uncharacterized protein n=1 Tax=Leptolinea tardivitalis TaxID=229920 RepID=A0A0P6X251_9CHLR|nr:hypothetical protein [Leptolinea tardivitalis]KPL73424.1 hypothetical protein ADM99_04300 [Leptolinea tardivitalis]